VFQLRVSRCVPLHKTHDIYLLYLLKGTTEPSLETTRVPVNKPTPPEGSTGEYSFCGRGMALVEMENPTYFREQQLRQIYENLITHFRTQNNIFVKNKEV
jgi:hypothetical protein